MCFGVRKYFFIPGINSRKRAYICSHKVHNFIETQFSFDREAGFRVSILQRYSMYYIIDTISILFQPQYFSTSINPSFQYVSNEKVI